MDEYIEREAAINCLKRYASVDHDGEIIYGAQIFGAIGDIYDLPAADVMPVVRCCKCIHGDNKGKSIVFCKNFNRDMMPDDFCSVGERKEMEG